MGRSAPGRHSGASGCSAHWAPGSIRHSTQTSEAEVSKGTPKSESQNSQRVSAWGRTGDDSRRAIGRPPDGGKSIYSISLQFSLLQAGEWSKSTMTLKMTKTEDGAEISKCRRSWHPWRRFEDLGQKASRSGAEGMKKITSPSRSGQGSHLGSGRKSGSGNLYHFKSLMGVCSLRSVLDWTLGALGTLREPGRGNIGHGSGLSCEGVDTTHGRQR